MYIWSCCISQLSWNNDDGQACVLLLQGKEGLAENILTNSTIENRADIINYAPMIDATPERVYYLGKLKFNLTEY